MNRKIPVLAILAVVAATAPLAACGDDDEPAVDPAAPTAEEDLTAIEQLLLDYGAAEGSETCELYSAKLIQRAGGPKGCERKEADAAQVAVTVDEVTVEGDTADAIVTIVAKDKQYVYPVVREGGPTDSYDGWRLAQVSVEEVSAEAEEPAEDEDRAQDEAALDDDAQIENLMSDYGAAGKDGCDFLAADLISKTHGSLEVCRRTFSRDEIEYEYTVEEVSVEGDTATVVTTSTVRGESIPGKETWELAREGEPGDPYVGWKISAFPR